MSCYDCKHWAQNSAERVATTTFGIFITDIEIAENDEEVLPQRRCLRIIHGNASPVENDVKNEQAVCIDGENYRGQLWTLPTFSCSLFEKKDSA